MTHSKSNNKIRAMRDAVWLMMSPFSDRTILFPLLTLSVISLAVMFANTKPALIMAPFLAANMLILLYRILNIRKLLYFPWIFILIGLFLKILSWGGLAIAWSLDLYSFEAWPLTNSRYYFFNLPATLALLAFYVWALIIEDKKIFRSGFIIDSTLLFLSLIIFIFIVFNTDMIYYFSSINIENFTTRIQFIPVIYFAFIGFIAVLSAKPNNNITILFLFSLCPYAVHTSFETFGSYFIITDHVRSSLYEKTSLLFYYIAGSSLVFYSIRSNADDLKVKKSESLYESTVFVWVANISILVATPFAIWIRSYLTEELINPDYKYYTSILAGTAVLVRLAFLTFQLENQQKLLEAESIVDDLTGILNRKGFYQKINSASKEIGDGNHFFCLLDIDGFKDVNDSYGHHMGDISLRKIAENLSKEKSIQSLGRLGGDEFVFIFKSKANMHDEFNYLRNNAELLFELEGKKIHITSSIGAAQINTGGDDFSHLYRMADRALYQAKENYTGYALYDINRDRDASDQKHILELIQASLDNDRICIDFQPIYDIQSGTLYGVEALMRLYDENGKKVYPDEFIDLARRKNKIFLLTLLLLKELKNIIGLLPPVNISINIPPSFIEKQAYLEQLLDRIDALNVNKSSLLLEVTEEASSDIGLLSTGVAALQKRGYNIALDDFGAGSSSLSRLASLSIQVVKIDISLLRAAEKGYPALLDSAIGLSHRLHAKVVVEGIETKAQLTIAQRLDADLAQGFYMSRPLSLDALLQKEDLMRCQLISSHIRPPLATSNE